MSRAMKKAERLRRLEELLLNAPPGGYSTSMLATLLGTDRTLAWRDISELETHMIPICSEGNRYWIERRSYLSNVRLSSGESLMLYLAIRHQARRLTYPPPAMASSMEKLALALRHPLSNQLSRLAQQMNLDNPSDPQHGDVWEILLRGWYEGISVRFWYRKFDSEQAEERLIQPYLFEPALLSEGVYVIGYSQAHGTLRTYKVERILRASLTTERFERPADLEVDALLRHAWGVWYGEALHTVRLRFADPKVARRVQETRWHPSQIIEELPEGGVIWSVQVAGLIELVPWIRGWGPDVEVLEPIELRTRLAQELRRAVMLYPEETHE